MYNVAYAQQRPQYTYIHICIYTYLYIVYVSICEIPPPKWKTKIIINEKFKWFIYALISLLQTRGLRPQTRLGQATAL